MDIAFCDVQLPGSIGGLSFAVWVRTHFPRTHVILTSGSETVLQNLRQSNGFPFIPKPYDAEALASRLLLILAGTSAARGPRDPTVTP